jgi:hypothetical protein
VYDAAVQVMILAVGKISIMQFAANTGEES